MIRQRPLCIFARSFLCSVGVLPDGQACTQRSESTRICALRFVLRSVGILPEGQACASQSQPTSHTPVQQTGQGYDATSDRESRSGGTLPGWQDYPRLLLAVRALRIQSRTANHEHGFSPIAHYSSRITRAARLMLRSVELLHGQAEVRRSASACILAVPGRSLRSVGACTRRLPAVGYRPTTPDRRLWTGDCGLVPVDSELTTHDFRLSFLSRTSSFEPAFRLITHHSSLVTSSAGGLP